MKYLTIVKYDRAYDVIVNSPYCMERPFAVFMKTIDVFESLSYYVIDGFTVVVADSNTGLVYNELTIEEFYKLSREEYNERKGKSA